MRHLSWASYCINLDDNRKRATEIWVRMGQQRWASFMLQTLKERPRRALIPLDVALHNQEFMPRRWILEDCILMLAKGLLKDNPNPPQMDIRALHQFVCDYAIKNSSYPFVWPFQQMIIWLILDRCNDSQVRLLFETVLTHNLPLSCFTLLQFAERFMNLGQAHIGLEIIRNALRLGADPSSFAIQSACVKLLRIRPERDDWYDYQDFVVGELLDIGIQPNFILWNCIIQNAVEAGRYEVAWRRYNLGIDDGLKPSRITFLNLLKIAKAEKNDDALRSVIDRAHEAGLLPDNLEVVNDLLHAVLIIEQSRSTDEGLYENLFQNCLRYYIQYCDIGPLQELGCELGLASEWQPRDRQLPAPTPTIIGIMMLAYIERLGPLENLIDFHTRYDGLVASKHPLIAPVANTDHVSNAFLMRLADYEDGLPYCTTVIKAMMKRSPFGISPSSEMPSTTPNQTGQPTLQTWNILLRAYTKNRQMRAAEKVLDMIHARGFIPNKVTWTQLLSGYISEKRLDKVIYVAKAMKGAGIEYDDITIRTLQRIADKPRFFRAMDDGDQNFQFYYDGDRPSQPQIENETHQESLEKSDFAQTDKEPASDHEVP